MKKITFLILCLFAVLQGNAQAWTIATCYTTPLGSLLYGPMNSGTGVNLSNRTASIYPAPQLGLISGQTLNTMYFRRISPTGTIAPTGANFKIFLKEVADNLITKQLSPVII